MADKNVTTLYKLFLNNGWQEDEIEVKGNYLVLRCLCNFIF